MREYTASAEILAGVCLITASAAGVAFGGLNPAKSEREHNSQHKGQKTMNTSSKTINRVEYIAIKSTIRTTKDGQKRRESGYYFRARINGKWQNVNELTANGVILHASGAAYMGIFNLEKARVLLPMLAELLGIAATPQMVEAAEAELIVDSRQPAAESRQPRVDNLPSYNSDDEPLMTCKYCILNEMGHCRKQAGRLPADKEPKYLRLQNGTILELQFNCKQCEMTVDAVSRQQ